MNQKWLILCTIDHFSLLISKMSNFISTFNNKKILLSFFNDFRHLLQFAFCITRYKERTKLWCGENISIGKQMQWLMIKIALNLRSSALKHFVMPNLHGCATFSNVWFYYTTPNFGLSFSQTMYSILTHIQRIHAWESNNWVKK